MRHPEQPEGRHRHHRDHHGVSIRTGPGAPDGGSAGGGRRVSGRLRWVVVRFRFPVTPCEPEHIGAVVYCPG
ncbi:hypothetical protein GCM10009759_37320 [Kitasatospora saccharophila]|uniref:Uncharacterized protein n=1 Tax=Kitasatospora saccharophila TaxID=407973 RepID=A0ABN2X3I4_9ACTN